MEDFFYQYTLRAKSHDSVTVILIRLARFNTAIMIMLDNEKYKVFA
jgi:hypothetical protein